MHRIRVIGDGSCFFHCIANAYLKPYIEGMSGGKKFNRPAFIRKLRKELADTLSSKVDPSDANSKTYYQSLGRGKLESLAKDMPRCRLDKMKEELDSSRSVDNMYNEYVSNVLNKDIYILDLTKQDVYMFPDDDILYKDRDSIVIGWMPGHYELVGVMSGGKIKTLFSYDHSLIQSIRKRISVIKLSSGP